MSDDDSIDRRAAIFDRPIADFWDRVNAAADEYRSGRWAKATRLYRDLVEHEPESWSVMAADYADLCLRYKHNDREHALWLVRAALAGDGDADSYLQSCGFRVDASRSDSEWARAYQLQTRENRRRDSGVALANKRRKHQTEK